MCSSDLNYKADAKKPDGIGQKAVEGHHGGLQHSGNKHKERIHEKSAPFRRPHALPAAWKDTCPALCRQRVRSLIHSWGRRLETENFPGVRPVNATLAKNGKIVNTRKENKAFI